MPIGTNVIYQNDYGNILHLTRQPGIIMSSIIGVDKEINKNVFDENTMKKNILNTSNKYTAIKNKLSKTIDFYNNDKKFALMAIKENDKWYVYNTNNCKLTITIIKNDTLPNAIKLDYNIDGHSNNYTNSKYNFNKIAKKYFANYTIIPTNSEIPSIKNTIIQNLPKTKNIFELLKTNKYIFKVGYAKPITQIESFVIGSIIIFES